MLLTNYVTPGRVRVLRKRNRAGRVVATTSPSDLPKTALTLVTLRNRYIPGVVQVLRKRYIWGIVPLLRSDLSKGTDTLFALRNRYIADGDGASVTNALHRGCGVRIAEKGVT